MAETIEHPAMNEPTGDLIDHIRERYHAVRRRELPELVALARKVEHAHATDINAPHGLTSALEALAADLEAHMHAEESSLFPALTRERQHDAPTPIARLRDGHDGQARALDRIAAITHGFRLPPDACEPWTRLYAGLGKLAEDLDEHMHLENDILLPRLEGRV